MIDGVRIKKLVRHVDERGWLMEILRDDDEIFIDFGQVYVSACFPGIVKAWHCHEIQTDSFCVLSGNARIGLYDDREGSPTCGEAQSNVAGELNPVVVQIPPLVWHGFGAVGGEPRQPGQERHQPIAAIVVGDDVAGEPGIAGGQRG